MALNSLLVNGQRASFVVLPCRNKGNAGAVAIYGAGVRRVLGLGALVRGEQLERRQSSLIPDETYINIYMVYLSNKDFPVVSFLFLLRVFPKILDMFYGISDVFQNSIFSPRHFF